MFSVILHLQVAIAAGCFPPIYASFQNGIIYKYAKGRIITFNDIVKPDVTRKLCQKLFDLHNVDSDSLQLFDRTGRPAKFDKTPRPLDRMNAFIHEIPKSLMNPTWNDKFQRLRQELTDTMLKEEMEFIKASLEEVDLPVTLVHNDFHPGNILIDEDSGTITFLDMELSTFSYPYIDLSHILLLRDFMVQGGWVPPDVSEITEEIRLQYFTGYEAARMPRDRETGNATNDNNIDLLRAQVCLMDFVNVGYLMAAGMAWSAIEGIEPVLNLMDGFKERYYKQKKDIRQLLDRIKQLSQCTPETK